MKWDEYQVTHLRTLLAEGNSASTIGRVFGCSKNAVLGKANRMHIENRNRSPGHIPGAPRKQKMSALTPPVALLSVQHGQCRWPPWGCSAREFPCCGAPCAATKSYCDFHMLKARGAGTKSERSATAMPAITAAEAA